MLAPRADLARWRPTGELTLTLTARPHPLPHSLAAPFQVWGGFSLALTSGGQRRVLHAFEWELNPLAAWLARAPGALWQEALCVAGHGPRPGESLAQAVARLRAETPADEAAACEWADALWHFVDTHSLRRAFPGTALPELFIGCNHGAGEVSVHEAGQSWSAAFDMPPFVARLRAELLDLLKPWAAACPHPPARARAERLISALDAYPVADGS